MITTLIDQDIYPLTSIIILFTTTINVAYSSRTYLNRCTYQNSCHGLLLDTYFGIHFYIDKCLRHLHSKIQWTHNTTCISFLILTKFIWVYLIITHWFKSSALAFQDPIKHNDIVFFKFWQIWLYLIITIPLIIASSGNSLCVAIKHNESKSWLLHRHVSTQWLLSGQMSA